MRYEQVMPQASLKDYVGYFWILENSAVEISPKTFGAIADGSPGIIFQQSDNGNFFQNNKELPPIFLYGQTTNTRNYLHQGSSEQ